MGNNNKLGTEGERLAAEYLSGKGYAILKKNYRSGRSEIDIIARDGDILVFMSRAIRQRAPMPVEPAMRIGLGVARALGYAHGSLDDLGRSLNIVHRDVSPQNVLLGADGAVKLMDFGLAFASANHYEVNPNEIGGKLGYMAPEILIKKESTTAIDVFALGVTVWEALVGRRLFRGKSDRETARRVVACEVPSLSKLNPRVPESLSALIQRSLAKDPLARPSADELATELESEITRAGIDIDDDCVPRLVRLHQRVERVSKRPSTPAGDSGDVAAELERELTETQQGMSSRGIVVLGAGLEESGVVEPDGTLAPPSVPNSAR